MTPRTSWRARLADRRDLPRVRPLTGALLRRWGRGTLVVPAPREVDELMRRVPRGKVITVHEIRAALARRHRATIGCPTTTGRFVLLAARAAAEDEAAGRTRITPYWRTLKARGELNPKYPGGARSQRARPGEPVAAGAHLALPAGGSRMERG